MIAHVVRRALEAGVGPVWVATDAREIAAAAEASGAGAVMTSTDHVSGSDRIAEAVRQIDPAGSHGLVVNVQGDEPLIDPAAILAAVSLMADEAVDMGTLATAAAPGEEDDPNAVKLVGTQVAAGRVRALLFTRARAPWGEGGLLRHVGLYAWRRAALCRFVEMSPSPLEKRERLEQLRALEAGMRIDAALVKEAARGVDTPADLERVREFFARERKT